MGMIGMCPHCGKLLEKTSNLVPPHRYPDAHVGGRLCPGSGQNWRNPLNDKRPLWKDITPEKEEIMQFGARGEKKVEQSDDSPKKLPQGGSGTAPAEASHDEAPCSPDGFGFCTTHPTCDHVRGSLQEAQNKIADQQREIRARGEILDAIGRNVGERNCWMKATNIDWLQRMRDFAEDSELHQFERENWRVFRSDGVTLYAESDFFTAYYGDAAELWERVDDDHPAFHVMVRSDPPHRTVIHAIHLAAWVQLLASVKLPVQIIAMEDLRE